MHPHDAFKIIWFLLRVIFFEKSKDRTLKYSLNLPGAFERRRGAAPAFIHTFFTYFIAQTRDKKAEVLLRIHEPPSIIPHTRQFNDNQSFSPFLVNRCLRVKISTMPARNHSPDEKVIKHGINFSTAVSNIVYRANNAPLKDWINPANKRQMNSTYVPCKFLCLFRKEPRDKKWSSRIEPILVSINRKQIAPRFFPRASRQVFINIF